MHSKLALCMVAMLLPASALAQVTLRPESSPNQTDYRFAANLCSTTLNVKWAVVTLQPAPNASPLKLWATAGACDYKKGTGEPPFDDVPYLTYGAPGRTGTFSVKLSELPVFTAEAADGGTTHTCEDPDVELKTSICGAYDYLSGTTITQSQASGMTITYDTKRPETPTLDDVSAEDGAAKATFSVTDDDTDKVIAYAEHDGDVVQQEAQASVGFVRIKGLTNSVTYQVSLKAMDVAGNISLVPSRTLPVTPELTDGFFKVLKDGGSTEPGGAGCSTTGVALFPLALAALARALFRRSRR